MSKPDEAVQAALAQYRPDTAADLLAAAQPLMAIAWDEGFKQGGPMHDVNYDDPGAYRRNPYRKEAHHHHLVLDVYKGWRCTNCGEEFPLDYRGEGGNP